MSSCREGELAGSRSAAISGRSIVPPALSITPRILFRARKGGGQSLDARRAVHAYSAVTEPIGPARQRVRVGEPIGPVDDDRRGPGGPEFRGLGVGMHLAEPNIDVAPTDGVEGNPQPLQGDEHVGAGLDKPHLDVHYSMMRLPRTPNRGRGGRFPKQQNRVGRTLA